MFQWDRVLVALKQLSGLSSIARMRHHTPFVEPLLSSSEVDAGGALSTLARSVVAQAGGAFA